MLYYCILVHVTVKKSCQVKILLTISCIETLNAKVTLFSQRRKKFITMIVFYLGKNNSLMVLFGGGHRLLLRLFCFYFNDWMSKRSEKCPLTSYLGIPRKMLVCA